MDLKCSVRIQVLFLLLFVWGDERVVVKVEKF